MRPLQTHPTQGPPVTDVDKILEAPDQAARDAKVKRDQWGRYLLPHPQTGKQQAWTRVTTFADVLTEKFALHGWDERNIAWGMGQRPDLVAEAASYPDSNHENLNGIIKQAKDAARASAPANMGTAIHRFAERVDADHPRVHAQLDAHALQLLGRPLGQTIPERGEGLLAGIQQEDAHGRRIECAELASE